MEIQCIKTFKNLDGICKEGDVLTLEFQRYKKDYVIHPILYGKKVWATLRNKSVETTMLVPSVKIIDPDKLPEGVWKFCDANIAPKGSIKLSPDSWVAITEDGRRYPESTFIGAIGYQPLSKIFKKV